LNLAVQAPRAFATPAFLQSLAAAGAGLLARWPGRSRQANKRDAAKGATSQSPVLPNGIRQLALLGNAMLHKCRNASQPLSLLVFDFSELPELQALFGRRDIPGLGAAIARKLQGICATRAVVVRTSTTRFAVLLPSFDAAAARRAVTDALGKACCLDFDVDKSEMLLVPEFAVRVVHRDEEFVEAVYQNICLELLTARHQEQRRHDYLTLERESHTRPPRLAPLDVAPAA
jgi:GGDEF domain-containing protein